MPERSSMIVRLVTSEYDCGECNRPHQYEDPMFYRHRELAVSNVRFVYEEVN